VVACREGALAITELQKAGGKRLPVQQFLAGNPLKAGDRFDLSA
jgi:methionyl-tRNA formyltransferase